MRPRRNSSEVGLHEQIINYLRRVTTAQEKSMTKKPSFIWPPTSSILGVLDPMDPRIQQSRIEGKMDHFKVTTDPVNVLPYIYGCNT